MVAHGRGGRGRPIRNTFPPTVSAPTVSGSPTGGQRSPSGGPCASWSGRRSCCLPTLQPSRPSYRYVRAVHPTEDGRQGRPVQILWDGPFLPHYRGHKWPRASHRRVRRSVNRLRANPRSSPNGVGAEGRCGTSPSSGLCARGDAHLSTLRNCR